MATPNDVLSFWLGDDVANGSWRSRGPIWFKGGEKTDREIEERFGADLERAGQGQLDAWAEEPHGRLALVIMLDQFSRSVYRGTPQAFGNDQRVQALVIAGVEAGDDLALHPVERMFFYMPMMHSETLAHQERGVGLFERLAEEAEDAGDMLWGTLDYAREHRDLVAKFGRFPHRNVILGRKPTAEETAYLNNGGANYGQVAAK